MATKYPASIDTSISLPTIVDKQTTVAASPINLLRNAIIAIQAELGVKPSGVYSNIRGRLDILESAINGLQTISPSNDLGGTLGDLKVIGIQGRPVSSIIPEIGDVFVWNGIAWAPAESGNAASITNIVTTTVITSSYDAVIRDLIRCDPTDSGGFVINLPSAVSHDNKSIIVKNISSSTNHITITANGTEQIDESPIYIINVAYESITLVSDGVGWIIV
jgi:hypothetical protein